MINQKANMNDRPYIFPPLKIHKISRKFCYLNKKHRKLTEIDEAPLLANVPRTKSLTQADIQCMLNEQNAQKIVKSFLTPRKKPAYYNFIGESIKKQLYTNLKSIQHYKLRKQKYKKQNEINNSLLLLQNCSKRSHSLNINTQNSNRKIINQKQIQKVQTLRLKIHKINKTQQNYETAQKKQNPEQSPIFMHPYFQFSKKRNLKQPINKFKQYHSKASQLLKLPIKQIDSIPSSRIFRNL